MSGTYERKLMSITEAAIYMRVSRRSIYYWMETGRLSWVLTPSGMRRIYVDTLIKPRKEKR